MNRTNKIPISFQILYLLLAGVIAYLYYLKIVLPVELNAPNSIDSVASLQTAKPYQFRLLIPALFMLFKPLSFVAQKIIFLFYSVLILYTLVIVYQKFISEYFQNKKLVLFLAPVILYPVLWNYILLNQTFQYYDFTAILIFTLGLYFIIKEKFTLFFILFVTGIFNKETSGYLIFAYLLYNYKAILSGKIIINSLLLVAVYLLIKIALGYIFRNNPGDPVEYCMYENINIIKTLFSNKIYFRHLALNFGGLYIFIFLLFLTGRWKKFHSARLLFINLAFFPNILLGFFVTYYDEVRVYAEFIPLVTTSFLIYLSTFRKLNFMPAANAK